MIVSHRVGSVLLVGLSGCLFGTACSKSEAPAAWNALAACLAGNSATADLPTRLAQLRAAQLANFEARAAQSAWPQRCAAQANELHRATLASDDHVVLRRKLQDRFGCVEDKASCTFPTDSTLVSSLTELWEAAKSSGLNTEAAPGVKGPDVAAAPLLSGATWKSFVNEPRAVVGPRSLADGRAVFLLKASEGRNRPVPCELSADYNSLACTPPSQNIPEFPPQTIELVQDAKGYSLAGITDEGFVAYDPKTGAKRDVRGMAGALVTEGVGFDRADGGQGFVATAVKAGKAAPKPVPLPMKQPLTEPISFAGNAVWIDTGAQGPELVAKALNGAAFRDVATVPGPFSGRFHTCQRGDTQALATWERHAGQHGAKATVGKDRTQLTVVFWSKGRFGKAVTTTVPFERAVESELVCNDRGASFVWGKQGDKGAQVSRVDCSEQGCTARDVVLPTVSVKLWLAIAPIGDKVALVWRSELGETRLRVGPVEQLGTAKDTVLFESGEFGGPKVKEPKTLAGADALLLLFDSAQPIALRVGSDGAAKVLGP